MLFNQLLINQQVLTPLLPYLTFLLPLPFLTPLTRKLYLCLHTLATLPLSYHLYTFPTLTSLLLTPLLFLGPLCHQPIHLDSTDKWKTYVLAPIVEEQLFRGVLPILIRNTWGCCGNEHILAAGMFGVGRQRLQVS